MSFEVPLNKKIERLRSAHLQSRGRACRSQHNSLDNCSESSTTSANEVHLERLRSAIAIGLKHGLHQVNDCYNGQGAFPSSVMGLLADDGLLWDYTVVLFGNGSLVRLYKKESSKFYFAVIKINENTIHYKKYTHAHCLRAVRESLAARLLNRDSSELSFLKKIRKHYDKISPASPHSANKSEVVRELTLTERLLKKIVECLDNLF